MQVKLFTIPITDSGKASEELNSFLRSHRVIECIQQLVSNPNGTSWCFCVKYIDTQNSSTESIQHKRKDFKNELDEATFKFFSKLRDIRKSIALQDSVPAYAICTDDELAAMASLSELTRAGMLSVKGFGEKKFEKYGARIIEQWEKIENEKSSKPL